MCAIALALAHTIATWGYVGFIWGDIGVWLHDAERATLGETAYRDFHWPYPPLGIWLLGLAGRVFGTSAHSYWLVTSAIFLLIVLLFVRYASQLIDGGALLATCVSGVLLATAIEEQLSRGTHTPSFPLGFLMLLAAVLSCFRLFRIGGAAAALAVGIFSGLAFGAKHDFWIPAAYVIAAGSALLVVQKKAGWQMLAGLLIGSFLLTLALQSAAVLLTAGTDAFLGIWGGGGQVTVVKGRSFPSQERIVLEIVSLACLAFVGCRFLALAETHPVRTIMRWTLYATAAGVAGSLIFIAANLGVYEQTPTLLRTLVELKRGVLDRSISLFLPVTALFLLIKRRASLPKEPFITAGLLLMLCIAARARRLFEFTEWFHVLLELPVYIFVLRLLLPQTPKRPRVAAISLGVMTCFAAYMYWNRSIGPLTVRDNYVQVETVRGTVFLEPGAARLFRGLGNALDRADPAQQLPLFALGHSGGFNYFYGRHNPTPLTLGFWLSNFAAEPIAQRLKNHHQPLMLISNGQFLATRESPSPTLQPLSWKLPMVEYPPRGHDFHYFQQIVSGCHLVETFKDRPPLTLYRCPPRGLPTVSLK